MAATNSVLAGVIGYSFTDLSILDEALLLPGPLSKPDGNKRLALVGDKVMGALLVVDGYKSGRTKGKGKTFNFKDDLADGFVGGIQKVVEAKGRNDNLEVVARQHELEKFIVRNPSQPGALSAAALATTMEAVIGAAFLDGDLEAAGRVMRALSLLP